MQTNYTTRDTKRSILSHTPAPWVLGYIQDGDSEGGPNGRLLLSGEVFSKDLLDGDFPICIARDVSSVDSVLIAAAPELKQAVENLLSIIAEAYRGGDGENHHSKPGVYWGNDKEVEQAISEAQSLLRKITAQDEAQEGGAL
jgi:hypothetical protein